ncbi:hypothetical protein EYF80_055672 [Liparis tanakae]|uniref:Uncharacterized protein n=1 Tax=Liparis tanakae TaxID=230148 RepID=A0A4Z2EZG9_9TELE|nr:hypothetical protein EYF80_055672 [Liparis tanakae]
MTSSLQTSSLQLTRTPHRAAQLEVEADKRVATGFGCMLGRIPRLGTTRRDVQVPHRIGFKRPRIQSDTKRLAEEPEHTGCRSLFSSSSFTSASLASTEEQEQPDGDGSIGDTLLFSYARPLVAVSFCPHLTDEAPQLGRRVLTATRVGFKRLSMLRTSRDHIGTPEARQLMWILLLSLEA